MRGDMLGKAQQHLSDASVEDKLHGIRVNTVAIVFFEGARWVGRESIYFPDIIAFRRFQFLVIRC